jgi:hypothetical protein
MGHRLFSLFFYFKLFSSKIIDFQFLHGHGPIVLWERLVRDTVKPKPQISPHSAVRGRPFVTGNPGRKLGSRNRATVIASGLLEDDAEALVRKAVELAKAGDVVMLKFLLGRILPRERLIKLELPRLDFADDAVEALVGCIMRAVLEGKISPT